MLVQYYYKLQKQPPEVLCKKRYSYKFHNIHRKTPVPESLFNKVAGSGDSYFVNSGNKLTNDMVKDYTTETENKSNKNLDSYQILI